MLSLGHILRVEARALLDHPSDWLVVWATVKSECVAADISNELELGLDRA